MSDLEISDIESNLEMSDTESESSKSSESESESDSDENSNIPITQSVGEGIESSPLPPFYKNLRIMVPAVIIIVLMLIIFIMYKRNKSLNLKQKLVKLQMRQQMAQQ